MRNGVIYCILIAVFLSLTAIVTDVYEAAGFDLDTHPVFRWVMAVAYSIIILSFLALIGATVWRGLRRPRSRN